MDDPTLPEGLSAVAFFARRLEDCSPHVAHLATGLSYTTVCDHAHGVVKAPRLETLERLQRWSVAAAARRHGCYILATACLDVVAAPDLGALDLSEVG